MDIGTGTTVAFATTSFAPQVTNVSWDGISREEIDSSHMGTTGARTSIPGDLYDPGDLVLEIWFVSSELSGATEMWKKPAETMTLTFPDSGTFVASVFCTGFSLNDPMEDGMTATVTFKIADDITIT